MQAIKNIIELLNDKEAALIFTPTARQYLSGFRSSLGYLFITKSQTVLFVDGRYIEAAETSVSKDIKVLLITDLSKQVKSLLADNNILDLITETSVTVGDVNDFKKLFDIPVCPSDALQQKIKDMRIIKTDDEVESIIKAQQITEKAFDDILNFIRPGVTENEIAARLEYVMKVAGSEEPSFSTIAVTGAKTSMPHGTPADVKVKAGDFITMDFGAVYGGYHSDMTRTVAVGSVSDEMQKVYDTVLKANLKALDAVRAGVTAATVDLAARDVIKSAGYGDYFTHSTGHGVGLDIHEAPTVSFKNEAPLNCGAVITIEPGIYIKGEFGVRIEDMVVVTKNGCNNLTKAAKSLIII